eukprot:353839-Chlamydomonas_euryale.AAC.35
MEILAWQASIADAESSGMKSCKYVVQQLCLQQQQQQQQQQHTQFMDVLGKRQPTTATTALAAAAAAAAAAPITVPGPLAAQLVVSMNGERTMWNFKKTLSQPSVPVVSTVTNFGNSKTSCGWRAERSRADAATAAIIATCIARPPAVIKIAQPRSVTSLVMMLETTLARLCAVTCRYATALSSHCLRES